MTWVEQDQIGRLANAEIENHAHREWIELLHGDLVNDPNRDLSDSEKTQLRELERLYLPHWD